MFLKTHERTPLFHTMPLHRNSFYPLSNKEIAMTFPLQHSQFVWSIEWRFPFAGAVPWHEFAKCRVMYGQTFLKLGALPVRHFCTPLLPYLDFVMSRDQPSKVNFSILFLIQSNFFLQFRTYIPFRDLCKPQQLKFSQKSLSKSVENYWFISKYWLQIQTVFGRNCWKYSNNSCNFQVTLKKNKGKWRKC